MSASDLVGLGLLVLNVVQFFFWARQNQALVDKLMSRNYAEYIQTSVSAQRPSQVQAPSEAEDTQHSDVLTELNALLGGR